MNKTIFGRSRRAHWFVAMLGIAVLPMSGCFLFNQSPVAQFTVSGDLRPGVEISFVNTSTDPNGNDDIAICSWNFGDETYADSFNAKHEYAQSGTYQITLTVYDTDNNVSSYSLTIDVLSDVFDGPDLMYVCMGKSSDSGPSCGVFGACIPETRKYSRDVTNSYWIVDYPVFIDKFGNPYLWPEDIVFWIPVRLMEDLSQSIRLVMSWHLTNVSTGEGLLYYADPDEYVVEMRSSIRGINAMWDFWGQTEKEYPGIREFGYNDYLPRGYYNARLTILEKQTGEKFVWDFPFRVCHGGCQ
ncbi:MAG: PKD domain-containing protein [Candidatus Atribacteria bacterium]|nr:MAG: PKD domain-containing protein [Candidatus Atribacteria bacterium]